jgi:prepilin-type N-terminal cleavage/methylation domain-containing protein
MRNHRGFTLLEVIVVLIIASMIAAVLLQGLSLILTVRTTFAQKLFGLETAVLQRNLFLEPLRGLVPEYPEKPDIFVGSDRRLHGLTVRSIQNRPGAPVGFDMYFDYDVNTQETTLMYQERGRDAIRLGSWPGNSGSFSYRDRTGDWLSAWPPAQPATDASTSLDPPPDAPQTPYTVRIEMGVGFPAVVIADITGPHSRITRLKDTPFAGSNTQ